MSVKQRLQDIAFLAFQRYLVEGDTSIFDNPEDAETLLLEFIDLTASTKGKSNIMLENRILEYSLKLDKVNIMISSLRDFYSDFFKQKNSNV